MESTALKFPSSGGSPLHPISPRRINQQRMNGSPVPFELPQLQTKSDRSSDVQSKVAFLNSLSGTSPTSTPHSSTTTAALQRAILGREEAESALQATTSQLSEAKSRERRVSERLESLLEELHSFKERQSHERSLYEKEVRKARKEAFRASSAIVKAQEELKFCRAKMKGLKEEVKVEREAKDKAEQEAFERAYTLAGLTEEVEVLRERVKASEMHNQSEELEAKAEVMRGETQNSRTARADINSMSCSPESRGIKRDQPDSVENISPVRKRSSNHQINLNSRLGTPVKLEPDEESCAADVPKHSDSERDLLQELKEDLLWEKRLRTKAEDMIHFLKMECQFNRCSCRIAEKQGTKYVHDVDWSRICEQTEQKPDVRSKESVHTLSAQEVKPTEVSSPATSQRPHLEDSEATIVPEEHSVEPHMVFCPDSGTFQAVSSPKRKLSTHENYEVQEQPLRLEELTHNPEELPVPDIHPVHIIAPEYQAPTDAHCIEISSEKYNPEPCMATEDSLSTPTNMEVQGKTHETIFTPENLPCPSEQQYQPTQATPGIQTFTTTTTVPLVPEKRDNSEPFTTIPGTPVSREEALAQIRARRGRTQSALKRSASANDANPRLNVRNGAATPSRAARTSSKCENLITKSRFSRRGASGGSNGY